MQKLMEGMGFMCNVLESPTTRKLDLKPQSNVSFSSYMDLRAVYVSASPPAAFPNHYSSSASYSNVQNAIFAILQAP